MTRSKSEKNPASEGSSGIPALLTERTPLGATAGDKIKKQTQTENTNMILIIDDQGNSV